MTEPVAVVGAGLGGLAAAIALASRGRPVRVFEKNPEVGGKLARLAAGGYTFDLGPSLLTLPDVFRELFAMGGADFDERVGLARLAVLCRYRFADGSGFDLPDGLEAQVEAIRAFNPREADAWRRFAVYARELYDAASAPFMRRPVGDVSGFDRAARLAMLGQLPRVLSPRSLDGLARRFFRDERLVQLVGRFATYNGSTPYRAPATFAVIAHVEHELGAYHVPGGMYRVAEAELDLARALGVEVETGREVEAVEIGGGRVRGVRLRDGERVAASAVVVNADPATAYARLLPADADPRARRRLLASEASTSALVGLVGVRGRVAGLEHHNVFFSSDYRREFADIFRRREPPGDPTVYVCAATRTDPSQAPEGCDALFVMVNLPALGAAEDREATIARVWPRALERLSRARVRVAPDAVEHESHLTPSDFAACYGSRDGSIYGASSNTRLQAFLRQPNRSRRVPGLFFAGGGAHPGGGMPLVTLSGLIAARLADEYLRGG
jgi:phytoene desaturase